MQLTVSGVALFMYRVGLDQQPGNGYCGISDCIQGGNTRPCAVQASKLHNNVVFFVSLKQHDTQYAWLVVLVG